MSKIKHMFVTGDSFSFGQELGGSDVPLGDFYEFTPYMRQHSYTGLIANRFNIGSYENISLPGGSNDMIHRHVLTRIPELLQTYAPDEIFVCISMTHAARREFFSASRSKYVTLICNHYPDTDDIPGKEYWKLYTAHITDLYEDATRYMMQVLSIQSFLKSHGIKYLITQSMGETAEFTNKVTELYSPMIDMIDRVHYPVLPAFNHFAGAAKVPFGKHKHPLEAGHILWANFLSDYIIEKGIL